MRKDLMSGSTDESAPSGSHGTHFAPLNDVKVYHTTYKNVRRKKSAQTLVEYALLLALIFVVVVAAVRTFGGNLLASFDNSSKQIEAATK